MDSSRTPDESEFDQEIHAIASNYANMEDLQEASFVLLFILKVVYKCDPLPASVLATCTESLLQSPELYNKLKLAHAQGKYNSLQPWWVLHRPRLSPGEHLQNLQLDAEIEDFLDRLRPGMIRLVTGEKSLPLWLPKPGGTDSDIATHIAGLKVPLLNSRPNLLLHGLGYFKDDPILKRRLDDIFVEGKPTFFINTAGSGKTRLVFEGLCQHWGFYFTSAIDSSHLGSYDVSHTIEQSIPGTANFRIELPPKDKPGYDRAFLANRIITDRRFSEVLLARLLIFRLFAEIMCVDGVTEEHKRRWLLLQLQPFIGHSGDIFESLTCILTKANSRYIDVQIGEVLRKVRRLCSPLDGRPAHLFCVLDAAEAAGEVLSSAFVRDDRRFPLLREIVFAWGGQTKGEGVSLIVAGTQISKDVFEEDSEQTYRWCSNTGTFDQDSQRRYMLRYFPPAYADSAVGDQLFRRLWCWLRGRYSFTAVFISILLQNSFRNPHTLLDKYIKHFTKFCPTDAQELVRVEGNDRSFHGINYGTFGFSILKEDPLMMSTIRQVLFHFVTSDGPAPLTDDSINLISHSYGRFLDSNAQTIVFDEPLTIIAAAQWFNDNDILTSRKHYTRNANLNSKDFRTHLAFYLLRAFDGKRELSDVFDFRDGACSWAEQKVESVELYRAYGGNIEEGVISPSDFAGSLRSPETIASALEKTFMWIDHRHGALCFPPSRPSLGPDLIFVLKLADGCFIWVILESSKERNDIPPASDLQDTTWDVTVSILFNETGDAYSTDEYTTPSEDVLRSIKTLPNSSFTAGELNSLRVVVPCPAERSLPWSGDKDSDEDSDEDFDEEPIASLSFYLFDKLMENIWKRLLEGIATKVVGIPKDVVKTTGDTDMKRGKKSKRARIR